MEATITVHVRPRSGTTSVERDVDGQLLVRVRSVPEGGRATREAARAVAAALEVPPTHVELKSGARSRVKIFTVIGLTPTELATRLQAL